MLEKAGYFLKTLGSERFPKLVTLLAQNEIDRHKLAQRPRLLGLLLRLLRLADHVGAQPRLGKDHGGFLADAIESAGHEWPERLAALLLADGVLDEESCVPARLLADAEAGAAVIERLPPWRLSPAGYG